MRACIIRPLGRVKGIDFDRVERELIAPALERLGIEGWTTIEIPRQGDIPVDLFQRLLTADLVFVDLSGHNADVFREVGMRHVLRDRRTFLLRCNIDQPPYDARTGRHFVYEKDDPAASLDGLTAALLETLRPETLDSPGLSLLPDVQAPDRSCSLPVPRDFLEEVQRAFEGKQAGDLGLLSDEVRGLEWEAEGLRMVGRAQFELRDFEGARFTWEALRRVDPRDLEANTLGTPAILLFTGHMIDAPGRKTPRFPPDKEPAAREAIEKAVRKELERAGEFAFGIAGGACGGDILFHEISRELDIPTELYLALPPASFIRASVAHGGPNWVERFNRLCERLTPRVLSESEKLPTWLGDKPNYTLWQRNNLWMLYNALASGGANVTLIALWDGKKGDGPGGTEDLVAKGEERGVTVVILDSGELFGFSAR